ncbi:MAG: response regulator, partial [Gammaproteobacteria bacterium]|nr:response regulator [Gammaproteobacteria bacterium]
EDGHGSLFSLLVPKREKINTPVNKPAIYEIKSGLENMNLFYVDDDEENIHAMGALTDNWGCNLQSATSVSSAKNYLHNHAAPNVILMDFQLGNKLNGVQLADEMRLVWGDIPVCIVSAAADEDLPTRVTSHGFDFLRKPIKPGKLRALLERYSQR